MGKRIGIGVLVAIASLLLVAGVLYAFGGMVAPTAEVQAAYAAQVASGAQPAIEPRFVISIPGCVCHSDDPALQMQHAGRRLNECAGCHSR